MPAPKDQKPKDPVEAAHEEWFFALDPKYVVQLMTEWNEQNLNIVIKNKKDYDAWFNYFRKMPTSHIRMLVATGQDILDAEAYSALRMWADIISNPARMNKVHQTGLSKKGSKKNSILALAQSNDRLAVLKATRDKIAEKLDKGAGSRDTALLTREMTEIMTQIADYEKRLGPKADTPLGALFADMPEAAGKREKNAGARNTSYRARVTIDDLNQPPEEAE
jgi:hypothetical protein